VSAIDDCQTHDLGHGEGQPAGIELECPLKRIRHDDRRRRSASEGQQALSRKEIIRVFHSSAPSAMIISEQRRNAQRFGALGEPMILALRLSCDRT
jgi:hypothetical protein